MITKTQVKRNLTHKLQTFLLGAAVVLGFSACDKMDTFEKSGMLEFFMVEMIVTPGIDDQVNTKRKIVALASITSEDETVKMAFPTEAGALSLRQKFLKKAEDQGALDVTAKLLEAGLDVMDEVEVAGVVGKVVPNTKNLEFKITGFEYETPAIEEFGIEVKGYGRLDATNKSYFKSELAIIIRSGALEELAPQMWATLEFDQNGKKMNLSEIDDPDFEILILRMAMNGMSTTSLL